MLRNYRNFKILSKHGIFKIEHFSAFSTVTQTSNNASKSKRKGESERMKRFHEQLKLEKLPKISPGMRFVDLVLVNTDENGELLTNTEKNPTKWGDWQHNGRVTDF